MDVKFTQSTDGGSSWSAPVTVNDNVDAPGVPTDQFQPSVAAGPGGAVAVAFYDRRLPCPSDPSILPADVGRTDFCIDVSLQAYKDSSSRCSPPCRARASAPGSEHGRLRTRCPACAPAWSVPASPNARWAS